MCLFFFAEYMDLHNCTPAQHLVTLCDTQSFMLCICVSVLQTMCRTSSARPQCTITFPSIGTVSSSVFTLAMTARNASATSSSPSSCRYDDYSHTDQSALLLLLFFHFEFYLRYIYTQPCGVVLFLGAAVGACTPGVCTEGQREKWCHLRHGFQ